MTTKRDRVDTIALFATVAIAGMVWWMLVRSGTGHYILNYFLDDCIRGHHTTIQWFLGGAAVGFGLSTTYRGFWKLAARGRV
jgi:hypothetical protein